MKYTDPYSLVSPVSLIRKQYLLFKEGSYLFFKRVFDLFVVTLLSPFWVPIYLFIAFSIKTDSYGPIIFKQKRVGMNGEVFTFYKFRTMFQGSEAKLNQVYHLNDSEDGVIFKLKKDPRITRVGKILRKLSLDELPQLWNVIKGEMSLVGPRPPIVSEVEKYSLEQRRRLMVRPGLTCIWQISGRSDLPFRIQLKLDKEYIRTQSFWLDFKILVLTIPAVITGRGAY
jgi:lipopolysaccharide/colanic/teichoic acid biosynthesis glycosyltransferase